MSTAPEISRLKQLIHRNARIHRSTNDECEALSTERDTEAALLEYCSRQDYTPDNLPRKYWFWPEDDPEDTLFEYGLITLSAIAVNETEIAQLLYLYYSSFWPDFISKGFDDWLDEIKETVHRRPEELLIWI